MRGVHRRNRGTATALAMQSRGAPQRSSLLDVDGGRCRAAACEREVPNSCSVAGGAGGAGGSFAESRLVSALPTGDVRVMEMNAGSGG